ncbi:MAG: RHS repeat-associated core domain-containing protein, partial [Terracidiphilus sp.]
NIYIADWDNERIREVIASSATIVTVAGNGTRGYAGDGLAATSAELDLPWGVAVDGADNIYIADTYNCRIREVTAATGVISTFAGSAICGFSGDDGPATSAELSYPNGVAVDSAGNVYIADTQNGAVREVMASSGNIWTVWQDANDNGSGIIPLGTPVGVAVDGADNLYFSDTKNNLAIEGVSDSIIVPVSGYGYYSYMPIFAGNGTQGFSGDGGPAIDAEIYADAIASDIQGNIYLAGGNRIRVVANAMTGPSVYLSCNPNPATYSTNINCTATVMGNNPTGTITWTVNGNSWATTALNAGSVSISGGAAWLPGLYWITASYSGDDANSSSSNSNVITISPAVPTISIGNIPSSATYGGSFAVTYTYSGNESPIVSVSSSTPGVCTASGITVSFVGIGTCTLAASASATPDYAAVTGSPQSFTVATPAFVLPAQGNISTIAGNGTAGYSGDGGAATGSEINAPRGSFVDSAGNVYIVDYSNNRIRKITASTGIVSTVAGNGTAGYSGDGGQATSAKLNAPTGVAVDSAGNLYIADDSNNRIREVNATTGVISTIAGNGTAGYSGDGGPATSAEFNLPSGVVIDAAGNIYIADSGNNRIREVNASTSVISTIAGTGTAGYSGDGGAAISAELNDPTRLVLDSADDIYFADTNNNRIREVTAATGVMSTVAGNGTAAYSGDGGAATSAKISGPRGVAVDSAGDIYIADTGNNRIRMVTAGTTVISTIAGNGTAGFSGDGGTAVSAELNGPFGVALDSARNIYIADTSNQRIRVVGGAGPASPPPPAVVYDTGTVNLYVCGSNPCVTTGTGSNVLFTDSTSYGQTSTPESVAEALAGSNSSVNVAALNNTLYIEATGPGAASDYGYLLTSASNYPGNVFSASFQGLPASGSLGGGASASSTQQTVYSYSLVYDPAGNVSSVNDSVMGAWNYGYDTLNRLVTGQDTATTSASQQFAGQNLCWAYDSFGNRTVQSQQSAACPAQSASMWVFNANNQVGAVIAPNSGAVSPSPYTYDAAGDVTMDETKGNQYLYDAEGRICASLSQAVDGTTVMTGYVYNADGNRVAKGTITSWTCDPSSNGLTASKNETDYILGPGGQQVTEVAQNANGTMNWQRTYVSAGTALIATYESVPNPLYIAAQYNPANPTVDPPTIALPSFRLTDWLGTMRATTDSSGVLQGTCTGLPYGDGVACSGDIPDPHHFTGKERDAESGNDYFGARYYASTMGRWLSPDWSAKEEPVPYAKMDDPQTLNLYAYMQNNPLGGVDADGHCPWCLALAGGGILTDEAPLAATGPIGLTVIGVTAAALTGVAIYQHFHNEEAPPPAASPAPAPAQAPHDGEGELHAPGDVPNGQTIVHGGEKPIPASGKYSAAQGASVEEAGRGVPHGKVKVTTAGKIRAAGGTVRPKPEPAYPGGPINGQHVDVTGGQDTFTPPQANPAPRDQRVQSRPQN